MILSTIIGTPLPAFADNEYITLPVSELYLEVGEEYLLTADVNPSQDVSWSSSDENVATVTDDGYITAISEGLTTLTVTADEDDLSTSIEVNVVGSRYILLSISDVVLEEGDGYQLVAGVQPAETESQNVTWSSSDNNIATVNSDGYVTAVSEGSATITVTSSDEELSAFAEISVLPKERYILLPFLELTLEKGEEYQAEAGVYPVETENQNVTWSSSNNSVATVTSDGYITAISEGTATMTVTSYDQELIDYVEITVISNTPGSVAYYSVTYNNNTGTGSVPATKSDYVSGDTVTVKGNTGNLTKTGHTFAGWSKTLSGGTVYKSGDTFKMGSSSVILYARWTPNKYTVSFVANGGTPTPSSQSVEYNKTATKPSISRNGYQLAGWYTSSNFATLFDFSTKITSGRTLYAKWEPVYKVTYSANGGSGTVPTDNVSYTNSESATIKGQGNLTRTGYSFAGWALNSSGTGSIYSSGDKLSISSNVTFYAKWTPNSYGITKTSPTNGSFSVPTSGTTGSTITISSITANTGYSVGTVSVKRTDGTAVTVNGSGNSRTFTMPAGSVTAGVTFTPGTVTITWNNNDGSGLTTTTSKTVGSNMGTLPTPNSRDGYTFAGWYTTSAATGGSKISTSTTVPTSNTTYYARWTALYSVTYNGNGATGGSVPSSTTSYTSGDSVTVKGNTGNLVKTGHVFAGWTMNSNGTGTVYTSGSTYTIGSSSITFYAKWTPSTVTVTWDYNGGYGSTTSSSKTVGGTMGTLPEPNARTGYSFAGWYTTSTTGGSKISTSTTVPTSNTTYYARWTALYSVTYNGNGATGGSVPSSTTSYTSGDTVTVKGNTGSLTKTGHTFAGWTMNSNGTGTVYTSDSTYTIGSSSITFYAKWTPLNYTVSFVANSGTPVPSNQTIAHGSYATQPSISRTNYTFGGWYTSSSFSGSAFNFSTTPIIANTTLYAKWTQIPSYTLTYSSNWPSGADTTGSVPSVSGNSYQSGTTVTVSGNKGNMHAVGYVFKGWATSSTATNPTYAVSGQTVTPSTFTITGNVTLYAVWGEATVGSQTNMLSVTRQTQGDTLWCWAAVASMMTNYEGVGKTQLEIVTETKQEKIEKSGHNNHTGSALDVVSALKWAGTEADDTVFANANSFSLNSSNYNTAVVDNIMAGKPVPVACFDINYAPGDRMGHFYLIYGIKNTHSVCMIDPWESNPNLRVNSTAFTTDGFYSTVLSAYVKSGAGINY